VQSWALNKVGVVVIELKCTIMVYKREYLPKLPLPASFSIDRLASIPNSHGTIVGTGGDVLAIGGPGHTRHAMKTILGSSWGMFSIGKDMLSGEAVP
jgi:hypothetical protein